MSSPLASSLPRLDGHEEPLRYWLLRFVPNVLRGEFVNVGVIVGRDDEWAMRAIDTRFERSRIPLDHPGYREWIQQLEAEISATRALDVPSTGPRLSRTRLNRLEGFYNNSMQISAGGPVAFETPEKAVSMLYDLLVAPTPVEERPRRKTAINRELEAYLTQWRDGAPTRRITKGPVAHVGRLSQKFDYALTDQFVGLTHTWSFAGGDRQTASRMAKDVRAWNLAVTRLRTDGATLVGQRSMQETNLSKDVRIAVLIEKPENAFMYDVYSEAREIWEDLAVHDFETSEKESLVTTLVEAP